jgi:hypothetical protein
MTLGQIARLRWACCFFVLIGIGALVADAQSGTPVELRYWVGAIVLIGFCLTFLYFSRNGWPPKSN